MATAIFAQSIKTSGLQLTPAHTTALQTLFTAGANGSRIDNIFVSSTDSSAKDLQFVLTISSVDYIIGMLPIPANSGNSNSLPIVNVLGHAQFAALNSDLNGNKYLFIPAGAILKVKAGSTITTAKVINVIAQCGDY